MFETLQGYINVLKNGEEQFAQIVEEEANILFIDVVNDTPVDTGKAKAGWKFDNRSVPGRIEFTVWNDVPYVVYLEYGWSQQAPQGMLRLNLRHRRKVLQDRIRRRLARLASE